MTAKTGPQIFHNARLKRYPGGYVELMAAERPIFREPGWEDLQDRPAKASETARAPSRAVYNSQRSIRRARTHVRDIAMANQLAWFVTLTLDAAKVDRYNPAAVIKKVSRLLDNQVRRHGLRYVLVPELHKDGAIHFHGFFDWWPLDWSHLEDSGTVKRPGRKAPCRPRSASERAEWIEHGGKPVFNVKSWSLGFSTAIKVTGEYAAAVNYCVKYVGKDMEGGKIGGRWYYSGGKLAQPEVSYGDMELDQVMELPGAHSFCIEEARMGMAMWRGRVDVDIPQQETAFSLPTGGQQSGEGQPGALDSPVDVERPREAVDAGTERPI